jgi:opacity protein-like surface antigen
LFERGHNKMKTAKHVALMAAMTCVCMSTAQAAQSSVVLGEAHGKVLVGDANGFAPGATGSALADGTKVLVGEDSRTSIVYDGCTVLLEKPTLYTINSKTGCLNGSTAITTMIAPTADLAVVDPYFSGAPLSLLFLGGAAAIITTVVLVNSGRSGSRPISTP